MSNRLKRLGYILASLAISNINVELNLRHLNGLTKSKS